MLIYVLEVCRHKFCRLSRILEARMLVEVRLAAVEVLSVDLEAVEVPSIEEALEEHVGMLGSVRIDWREVVAIPPRDILRSPLVGEEHHLWVLFEDLGAWVSSERSPPEFSIHATAVNLIGHTAHVAVATREAVVGLPVAFSDLEAIIHVHPLESEFSHLVQCTDHLVDGKGTLVTPCTPYRLESLWF